MEAVRSTTRFRHDTPIRCFSIVNYPAYHLLRCKIHILVLEAIIYIHQFISLIGQMFTVTLYYCLGSRLLVLDLI